ncbi:MAG TPA: radical SAM protein [Acidobacteriota bacterium]|nr:radical SAM protein [Acidobacteriota bacterium]
MSHRVREHHQQLLKSEIGTLRKPLGLGLNIALAYANTYYIAMSNLGFQAVYKLFNLYETVTCERAFLPDRDILEDMERARLPLVTLESQTPVNEFDVLAFSISFETDYLNVPTMLRLAGIPVLREDRSESDPLVVVGGAATFLNPEPIADFVDVVCVGEGEGLVPQLVEFIEQSSSRAELLERLSYEPGFYVPSFYDVEYNDDGTIADIVPKGRAPRRVLRVRAAMRKQESKIKDAPEYVNFVPESLILTPHTEMSNRFMMEISRGCSMGCRFCWAGFSYLPPRVFAAENLLDRASRARPHTDEIGLVATAVCDHPEITTLLGGLRDMEYRISVSSLRLDQITDELLDALVESCDQTIAVAPETGSYRLRRAINKNLTDEEILDICQRIFNRGILNLKLYMMVGLPTEEQEDIDAIVSLTRRVRQLMIDEGRRFGRVGRVVVSLNGFVPKPHTPLQWEPMIPEKQLDKKIQYLTRELPKIKNVEVRAMSSRIAYQQTMLSLGDRRLSQFLIENDRLRNFKQALRMTDLDIDFYTLRRKGVDEVLASDMIDNGLSREFLLKEYNRAVASRTTPPCPAADACTRCAVCDEKDGAISYAVNQLVQLGRMTPAVQSSFGSLNTIAAAAKLRV